MPAVTTLHASTFVTKDSGARQDLAGGMVRDTTTGKSDPTLIRRGPMFRRWVELLDRGAVKYSPDNWMLAVASRDAAAREETRVRFIKSAARHFEQWLRGDRDEDHAAAVFFNINGLEALLETEDDQSDAIRHMQDLNVLGQIKASRHPAPPAAEPKKP